MTEKKPNRNDPCPCGSGKKYKKCCGQPGMAKRSAQVLTGGNDSILSRIALAGNAFQKEAGTSSLLGKVQGPNMVPTQSAKPSSSTPSETSEPPSEESLKEERNEQEKD